ncbi:MAG TPA: hypothetical protein VIK18_07605, partial [Pirellulales bacterium]
MSGATGQTADSGEHASTSTLLNLPLGSLSLGGLSLGGLSLGGLSLGSGVASHSNSGSGSPGSSSTASRTGIIGIPLVTTSGSAALAAQDRELLRLLIETDFDEVGFGLPIGPAGDQQGDASHDLPEVDVRLVAPPGSSWAQSLSQPVAQDARQADDPHEAELSAATVTARGRTLAAVAFQAPGP